MTFILGIDPGLQGAFALYDPIRPQDTRVWDMPAGAPAVATLVAEIASYSFYLAHACIENVHGLPRQKGVFNFGLSTGIIHGCLASSGIPMTLVAPQVWKQALGLTHQDKSASRALAAQLFPALAQQFKRVKDDGRAEALLIAVYFSNLKR